MLVSRLWGVSAEAQAPPGPADDYWYSAVGALAVAGVRVTPAEALKCSAVWACLRWLGQTIGGLPCHVYQRRSDGGKERAPEHPLFDVLRWQPNRRQTAYEFWRMAVIVAELYGSFYARIVEGPRGFASELRPVHPRRVQRIDETADGDVRFVVRGAGGATEVLLSDEMFWLPGISEDGISALGIPDVAKDAIGLSLAAGSYAARFFSQGANFGVILEHPQTLGAEASKRLSQSFQAATSGLINSHGTVVLEEGMKANRTVISPENAQAHETRKAQLEEVVRYFGIPQHKVGLLEHATFSNIEAQGIEAVTDAVMPRTIGIEQRIRMQLILAKSQYFAEFLLDALLRGTSKERAEVNTMYVREGIFSRNEVRIQENRNPLPGLDEPTRAANIGTTPNNGGGDGGGGGPAALGPGVERGVEAAGSKAERIALKSAERLVRREVASITEAAKRCASDTGVFHGWLDEFYRKHVGLLMDELQMDGAGASAWCEGQKAEVMNFGVSALERWQSDRPSRLAAMALGEAVAA